MHINVENTPVSQTR
uniref:Uncharacterized protein n=1 Tax=Anguilla anguilla TaxID=7936 RepID=A0A0E9VRB9_ANGAN